MNDEKQSDIQEQIDENYKFFLTILPGIIEDHQNKFALIRNQEIVDYFDTIGDAAKAAGKLYTDGLFSIQEVTNKKVDLGFFSHVA